MRSCHLALLAVAVLLHPHILQAADRGIQCVAEAQKWDVMIPVASGTSASELLFAYAKGRGIDLDGAKDASWAVGIADFNQPTDKKSFFARRETAYGRAADNAAVKLANAYPQLEFDDGAGEKARVCSSFVILQAEGMDGTSGKYIVAVLAVRSSGLDARVHKVASGAGLEKTGVSGCSISEWAARSRGLLCGPRLLFDEGGAVWFVGGASRWLLNAKSNSTASMRSRGLAAMFAKKMALEPIAGKTFSNLSVSAMRVLASGAEKDSITGAFRCYSVYGAPAGSVAAVCRSSLELVAKKRKELEEAARRVAAREAAGENVLAEAKKTEVKKVAAAEAKKPEAKKPETKKVAAAEVKKPEAKKPETKKVAAAEAKKPEAKKPDAKKVAAAEAKKPEAKKPETKKPETKKTEATKVAVDKTSSSTENCPESLVEEESEADDYKPSPAEMAVRNLCERQKWCIGWDVANARIIQIGLSDFRVDGKNSRNDKAFFEKREDAVRRAILEAMLKISCQLSFDAVDTQGGKMVVTLDGASLMTMSEGIDPRTGKYQVAVLVTWSKAFEKAARFTMSGRPYAMPAGKGSVRDWIAGLNPTMLVGSRKYIDYKGNCWLVGTTVFRWSDMLLMDERSRRMERAMAFAKEMLAIGGHVEIIINRVDYDLLTSEFRSLTKESEINRILSGFHLEMKTDLKRIRGEKELLDRIVTHPATGERVRVIVYGLTAGLAANVAK